MYVYKRKGAGAPYQKSLKDAASLANLYEVVFQTIRVRYEGVHIRNMRVSIAYSGTRGMDIRGTRE